MSQIKSFPPKSPPAGEILDFFSRIEPSSHYGSTLTGSDFVKTLGRVVKPGGVTFNTKLELKFGRNPSLHASKSNNNDQPSNGNSDSGQSKGKSKGRPRRGKSTSGNGSNDSNLKAIYPAGEVKTANVSFNTNIKSGTLVNPMEDSHSSEHSTLFVMAGSFLPSNASDTLFNEVFKRQIYFDQLIVVQREISYKADYSLSDQKLLKYYSSLVAALELYYDVDSILAYNVKYDNINPGMKYLRSQISAEILSKHEELKRLLVNCAIPPNLMTMIAYMHQNFKFDDTDNSPIMRLGFRNIWHDSCNQCLSQAYYDTIMDELTEDTRVISLLVAAFPNMRVSDLVPSSSEPICDPNFKTFWYNSNVIFLNKETGKIRHSRALDSSTEELYYGHFCQDDIDGAYYAMSSLYVKNSINTQPGIWVPANNQAAYVSMTNEKQKCNLLCFSKSMNKLVCPGSERTASQSGVFHNVYLSDKTKTGFNDSISANPAAQKVQVNNVANVASAATSTILYLFSGVGI